jgi:predicted Zn-dependent protease
MHAPDDDPEIESLLAPLDRDAPAPDRAFLAALRDRTSAAFQMESAPTPRNRIMTSTTFRWLAGLAATLVAGAVLAQWVVRMNRIPIVERVPEDRFAINEKLVDDGRLGKIADAQGIVSVKPVLAERWSPALPNLVLKPGDLLRTDARGANAASLRLLPGTGVVVGPHSLVELVKANEIRLLTGEVEVNAGKEPVRLLGPGNESLEVEGTQCIRIEKEKLVRAEKKPLWLQGFLGSSTKEALGSLIAKVDGRNVPLTVGFHHVNVDIRDQIARTVIEESFVNQTDSVLEGAFYFPLPADASISGFGMWIGDQLVEADVVEKQRAREIYETILREKRDPGLLEWAGGNIFKARVYPIPARSEKRIRISYTQVLPMQGNRYRYSYALQSDLLKQTPLRELKIDVKVNSAVPLKNVTSPTHDTRLAKTEHSGHVEFAAQEYTPTRDFETVIEVAGRTSDVVVIPHRRGSDGYFMVQLTPPGGAGSWERPLIPNGDPLKLQLIADTSASMDRGQRNIQQALVASILGSLTPKDSINLAMCDVDTDWVFEKPMPATPQNIAAIRAALDKRISLGWTNLDRAFASALARSDAGTHSVYLGDGISTHSDADPVAMAQRLNRMFEGKSGTFHAIALGSSYEAGVMKAIASLGTGSFRRVSGEQGPQAVAAELLTEIASPALRNVKVEFRGVRTARVYPEELPNIAAGSQQILLGRYLPEGQDRSGEIVVRGTLAGKPVQFVSKFLLKDAEQGNSFLPRLWARMHLDKLLQQGTSETIQQEVIALSEEFNIITPYTSLLVLESDADRERFAVKKRFRMSDGERFFAEGNDNATYELKQRQIRLAGDYRTALRRKVLAELQGLGRNPRLFAFEQEERRKQLMELQSDAASRSFGRLNGFLEDPVSETSRFSDARGIEERSTFLTGSAPQGAVWKQSKLEASDDFAEEPGLPAFLLPKPEGKPQITSGWDQAEKPLEAGGHDEVEHLFATPSLDGTYSIRLEDNSREWYFNQTQAANRPILSDKKGEYQRRGYSRPRMPLPWLPQYFPSLPASPAEWTEPKSDWPAEAIALSRSLLRREKLLAGKGGISIQQTREYYKAVVGLRAREERFEIASANGWLVRSAYDSAAVTVDWCDGKERGAVNTAYQLGRVRASKPTDLAYPPLLLNDESMVPLHASASHSAKVEMIAKDRALLTLRDHRSRLYQIRYLIDTARRVVVSVEHLDRGKTTGITKFDNFIEVNGMWWATLSESFDDKNRKTASTKLVIEAVSEESYKERMAKGLESTRTALILKQPLPSVTEAKLAASTGKATLEDSAVLVLHFAQSQQWSKAKEHLAAFEGLAKERSPRAMQILKDAFQLASREHESLRVALMDQAKLLAELKSEPAGNRQALADRLFGIASEVLSANEKLELWAALEKISLDQPAYLQAHKAWRQSRVGLLQDAGRVEETLALSHKLAEDFPGESSLQTGFADALHRSGRSDEALAWLDAALKRKREQSDIDQLKNLYAEILQQQGRLSEMAEFLGQWIEQHPDDDRPYARYLAVLVRTNQAAKAEALTQAWIKEGIDARELTKPMRSRTHAAIQFAFGQGHQFYSNRIEDRWLPLLSEAADRFAHAENEENLAENLLGYWKFQQTEAGRKLARRIAEELLAGAASLPIERLQRFWHWAAGWKEGELAKFAGELRTRWDAEKDLERKDRLGSLLGKVSQRAGTDAWLAFLRVQWQTAGEGYRIAYARQLFEALLSQPWNAEFENELFGLIPRIAETDDPAEMVGVLHRIDDVMLEGRYRAALKTIEHPEKLPRTELAEKHGELRRKTRTEYADRLRAEAGKHGKPLAQWMAIERIWLDVLTERDLKSAGRDAGAILDTIAGDKPLEMVLRNRLILTLTHLAARKDADPAQTEQLVKFCSDPARKAELYRLLIAIDRPKQLETVLGKWIREPESANGWKLALGRLLAEQGKLPEAIKLFEAVEADDELTPEAYQSLSQWYLAENQRAGMERARKAMYSTTDESALSDRLYSYIRPWRNSDGHMPSQIDPELFELLAALFEKSAWPGNYVDPLRQVYQATRDFRLLAVLADGTVGHTAGKVYPFLQAMKRVIDEIGDEATVDQLAGKIAEVRRKAKSPVDHRALELFTAMVERRAAELANQGGPHAQKALDALSAAFKREWQAGEPILMAQFLGAFGAIGNPALAAEQLRELETLHGEAKSGSLDHLNIALQYANVLNASGKVEPSMEVLESALQAFREARGGSLPQLANPVIERLLEFTDHARQFERGEKLILAQANNPHSSQQRDWLRRKLYEHYLAALKKKARVSLGEGDTLYQAIQQRLFKELADSGLNQRSETILQLVRLYRTGMELAIATAVADVKGFAFDRLPPILKDQAVNYDDCVREVAVLVRDLLGPKEGIGFLMDRVENEPDWVRYQGYSSWNQYASLAGEWRAKVKDLGDVEPRLLKWVLAELRREMTRRDSRNRAFFHRNYSYYWSEKKGDFAKTAEEVLRERIDSPGHVRYIAEYLFEGLNEEGRAIQILQQADARKKLDDSGRFDLADYLQRAKRYADSIPLLLTLIEGQKDNLRYRIFLMRAYHKTNNPEELAKWLKATDAYFHGKDRWNESVLSELAFSCLENKLAAEAVAYFEELIAKYQQSRPNRGTGDSNLSLYYQRAAEAYLLLGKTKEAIDRASAAVVVWPAGHSERKETLNELVKIIAKAPRLDESIASLDAEPLQSAILRKAIGQAFMQKNEHAKAIPQFQLAAELQPNDAEVYQFLVACLDHVGDKEGAMKQLLAGAENARRNVQLWTDLGRRLNDLGRDREAERAFTSTVEMLPHESESHAALADGYGKAQRWPEAVEQWKRVAEIRRLEPTGLLKLANAQIEAKQWNAVPETLRKLRSQSWPSRFSDVEKQTHELEQRFRQRKGAAN